MRQGIRKNRFYSDLEQLNKMDTKPFLEIDMLNLDDHLISELKKLTKSKFDLNQVLSNASDLKYTREIKKVLNDQLVTPEDDFVRYLANKVYSGKLTHTVRVQFQEIVKKAFSQFLSDKINNRLKSAMSSDESETNINKTEVINDINNDKNNERQVETTIDELEAYYIVKSILRDTIDPARIVHRDTLSYFGILLDDNNRKPICRLHFNIESKKYIGLFDEKKKETKIEIVELNDIYRHASKLNEIIMGYEKKS